MKAALVRTPGGLDQIMVENRREPKAGAGEVLVRIRAHSLNYHDYLVVSGMVPTADGRDSDV
jgi:NADPH:quinone reductase-like Zn-dependent oxidoreductase